MTTTRLGHQTSLVIDPQIHEAVRAERDELRAQVVDEVVAGERQAAMVMELHRLLEQVCPACRAVVDEAMAEEA